MNAGVNQLVGMFLLSALMSRDRLELDPRDESFEGFVGDVGDFHEICDMSGRVKRRYVGKWMK
jgi:hypothetical protein